MKLLVKAVVIACITLSAVPQEREPVGDNEESKSIEFRDVSGEVPKASEGVGALAAVIEVLPIQDLSAGGIAFSLRIDNPATSSIEVVNPLDLLRLRLFDKQGVEIRLPRTTPRVLINTREPPTRSVKVERVIARPRSPVGEAQNVTSESNTAQDMKPVFIDADTSVVEKESVIQFDLLVDRVLAVDSKEVIAPAAGEYWLYLTLSLVEHEGASSRHLQSGKVVVNLRAQASGR